MFSEQSCTMSILYSRQKRTKSIKQNKLKKNCKKEKTVQMQICQIFANDSMKQRFLTFK